MSFWGVVGAVNSKRSRHSSYVFGVWLRSLQQLVSNLALMSQVHHVVA